MTTHLLINGIWVPTGEMPAYPNRANFVIVCGYGDWSGFRPLHECLAQVPSTWQTHEAGFFSIEER